MRNCHNNNIYNIVLYQMYIDFNIKFLSPMYKNVSACIYLLYLSIYCIRISHISYVMWSVTLFGSSDSTHHAGFLTGKRVQSSQRGYKLNLHHYNPKQRSGLLGVYIQYIDFFFDFFCRKCDLRKPDRYTTLSRQKNILFFFLF